jgi:hypothetical protein
VQNTGNSVSVPRFLRPLISRFGGARKLEISGRGRYTRIRMLRAHRVLVFSLIFVFAAGVTCAAVCNQFEQAPKKHSDGSECNECISTSFIAGSKSTEDLPHVDTTWAEEPISMFPLLGNICRSTPATPSPDSDWSFMTLHPLRI